MVVLVSMLITHNVADHWGQTDIQTDIQVGVLVVGGVPMEFVKLLGRRVCGCGLVGLFVAEHGVDDVAATPLIR
ncbi:hypothetical protein [Actinomadura coerulea]|uniref:hypothetical protein n=1 Tax=Actinomadura coerulea TaxID=46159 RepID=UPI00343ED606